MAPIGRKQKAAPAETVDKREKLAEGPAVVIEHWTGIKKGPPRKLKFPEPQEVVKELKKYLS